MTASSLLVRDAVEEDRQKLASLFHFELRVHRHLDWHQPLDWLGSSPYLVAEANGRLVGALACPEDPPGIAWLQAFAAVSSRPISEIWHPLWAAARTRLEQLGKPILPAAIPMQDWLVTLLKDCGFRLTHQVVVLLWEYDQPPEHPPKPAFAIRPMEAVDLAQVAWVDAQAFSPLWQNTLQALTKAYAQAAVATVAEDAAGIFAYQLSTLSPMGGHLARLAVLPDRQGQGVGYLLVNDLLHQFIGRGALRMSVNTQSDNPVSLHLYEKMGFVRTGEAYPVYELVDPSRIPPLSVG